MELVNLHELKANLESKYLSEFNPRERLLPPAFKQRVRTINNNAVTYQNYTMVIEVQQGRLYSYIPNQWIYIAAFFCDYYNQLQAYRDKVLKITQDKEKIKNCEKNKTYAEQLLDSLKYNQPDREWLINFLSDYSWWGGAKTIDRNDFYVSPILSMANVVNASQSFIAEICKFLAQHPQELSILKDEIGKISEENPREQPLHSDSEYRPYITAIKSKPFILLAGISGTGKSRIVRELARACYDEDSEEYRAHKPANFEMIQVRPNWHDSTELLGYVSRINGDKYIAGDFLKFIVKAWENPDMPHFLCLDEMNLAPVEQYFAEYLSVIESRKLDDSGNIVTDPILKKEEEQWYHDLIVQITTQGDITSQFLKKGISIPQNLVVMGTVNMDETSFSFSRKVLDRAMSIEMNEVDLYGGLEETGHVIGKLNTTALTGTAVEGKDVYTTNKDVCDKVLQYLETINEKLECTPFKVAYRTRNEFLLYVVNNLPYTAEGRTQEEMIATALDEITSMKILSRIEGDESKITRDFLPGLKNAIKGILNDLSGKEYVEKEAFGEEGKVLSVSLKKLAEMEKKLQDTGYTSYWC